MGAKNRVVAGDYKGKVVSEILGDIHIIVKVGHPENDVLLNKSYVDSYEVITEDISQSATSGAIRGAVGSALFGSAGMLAGVASAKKKSIITLAVHFKDGKNSLLEIDEKLYKKLILDMF